MDQVTWLLRTVYRLRRLPGQGRARRVVPWPRRQVSAQRQDQCAREGTGHRLARTRWTQGTRMVATSKFRGRVSAGHHRRTRRSRRCKRLWYGTGDRVIAPGRSAPRGRIRRGRNRRRRPGRPRSAAVGVAGELLGQLSRSAASTSARVNSSTLSADMPASQSRPSASKGAGLTHASAARDPTAIRAAQAQACGPPPEAPHTANRSRPD